MDIDNSTLSTFKRCPRKYYYQTIKGVIPKRDNYMLAAKFGSAIHASLDAWFSLAGQDIQVRSKAMDKAFIDSWKEHEKFDESRILTIFRGLALLDKYKSVFATEVFDIVAVEKMWSFPVSIITDNEHMRCDVVYWAKIDAVVMMKDTKEIMILEHKTSGRRNSICTKPNSQLAGYVYVVQDNLRIPVKGVIVNELTYRKGGKGEATEDTVECQRVIDTYSKEELEYWRRDLNYWLTQLVTAHKGRDTNMDVFPMNTEHCKDYGACPYLELCKNSDSLDIQESIINEAYEPYIWEPWSVARPCDTPVNLNNL